MDPPSFPPYGMSNIKIEPREDTEEMENLLYSQRKNEKKAHEIVLEKQELMSEMKIHYENVVEYRELKKEHLEQIEDLDIDIRDLKEEIDRKKTEIANRNNRIETLDRQIAEAFKKAHDVKLEWIELDNSKKNSELRRRTENGQRIKKYLESIGGDIKLNKEKLKTKDEEIARLKGELQTMRTSMNQSQKSEAIYPVKNDNGLSVNTDWMDGLRSD